jgi:methylmalonyl-CoA mutase C-terminal domain/subunit
MKTMPEKRKIRVLAAKPGLDGHDRGIKVICAALRDAGMEVIYTGLRQTPEQIVAAAIQEDADVIAMSVLSGAHNYLFPRVMDLVREKGIGDVLVMGGGIIPDEDIPPSSAPAPIPTTSLALSGRTSAKIDPGSGLIAWRDNAS